MPQTIKAEETLEVVKSGLRLKNGRRLRFRRIRRLIMRADVLTDAAVSIRRKLHELGRFLHDVRGVFPWGRVR